MKITTDKPTCNALAMILRGHGVERAVLSPGTRNAPLIMAFEAAGFRQLLSVTDERVAAFMALGMAERSGTPVALVCTSGTALYNYAPGVAEAYMRGVPLIVVSADRPEQWIGQADSQTLRQPGALAAIVRRSYALRPDDMNSDTLWFNSRCVNDAMLTALTPPCGPVHINVAIDAPLNRTAPSEAFAPPRIIRRIAPPQQFAVGEVRQMAKTLEWPARVMVVCGTMPPDNALRKALISLSARRNVAIVAERVSNVNVPGAVWNPDAALLRAASDDPAVVPTLVITIGGALVSARLKAMLRRNAAAFEHWHIGHTDETVDTFRALTLRVDADPAQFMRQLSSAVKPLQHAPGTFAADWQRLSHEAAEIAGHAAETAPWSDLRAFAILGRMLPPNVDLQVSNGMSVRYLHMVAGWRQHRITCNRGVSGIDGSTSTAIGASFVAVNNPTVLITGDLSAQYDLGALMAGGIEPRMKIIVIDNGGGAIFRSIENTRHLSVCADRLVCAPKLDWRSVAAAAGMRHIDVNDARELERGIVQLLREHERPAMMVVHTCGDTDAAALDTLNQKLKEIKPDKNSDI